MPSFTYNFGKLPLPYETVSCRPTNSYESIQNGCRAQSRPLASPDVLTSDTPMKLLIRVTATVLTSALS